MRRFRVIPVLQISKGKLVKTVQFSNPKYIGDPINAVKIFNEKLVDELILVDIDATKEGTGPNIDLIHEVASEAFMPVAYGGGIKNEDQVSKIVDAGIEKIILNTLSFDGLSQIEKISSRYGAQSIVISVDLKKELFGKFSLRKFSGKKRAKVDVFEFINTMQNIGAGELFLNSIDNDGTMKGYNIELIKKISSATQLPLIANGGAGSIEDFYQAIANGASAVAAGSFFVYSSSSKGILISYPKEEVLKNKLYSRFD